VLSRAILEKEHPVADIILGIDNNLSQQALDADILEDYIPENADKIITPAIQAQLSTGSKLVPYDYSHFAMIFNTQSNLPEPQKLSDLTDPVYSKKIILMDPRTSTPGLGFVAWTKAAFTDDKEFNDFWQALKPNILTMANGWSAGYALFTAGEAPLVISYTTSPAANLEYDKIDYYKALIFEDGHYMQVEGAGILKNAPNKKGAKLFMDFLISDKAQNALPLTQWMYPVNQNVVMPECYAKAGVIPEKTVTLDSSLLKEAVETVISIVK
ncbi:thiamine ABC transporter substrate binding subunit, partial [Treponema sp.]|uniref:thiamine ABC transporter substrate-binding protein n=1 Tax=Treponema sp. TaxID=166 RepID=UPI00388E04B8